jgi:hypothetical protein
VFGIESIIFAIIALHCLALGWLMKAMANFILLYFSERKRIDLVIALVFLGLVLDRAWSIWSSVATYPPVGTIRLVSDDVYFIFAWRVASLLLVNALFLLFDIVFFRHKPGDPAGPE